MCLQGTSNTIQLAYMRQVNPAFRPVQYFMTHTAPSNHLEHIAGSLESVLMYAAGLLAQAINSSGSDATLNVSPCLQPSRFRRERQDIDVGV